MEKLQELSERATINFPKDVNFEEIERILGYVTEQLGENSRISGNFSGHLRIDQGGEGGGSYVSKVRGLMVCPEEGSSGFSLVRSKRNLLGYFSGLRFEPSVGYGLDEINPVELKLYDRVRKSIGDYFSEPQKIVGDFPEGGVFP
jgi:hypothetical protein|tara:strand:+ start:267 stop:701 length:435 start_codon:yes stop_codon:yes gene_type:complete